VRPAQRQRGTSTERGFTLIEILVVIIIIGVVLTFATLSVSPSGPSDRLDIESQRLLALSQAAADDAVLYGQTIGLHIKPDGYQFIVLGPAGWKPVQDPESPLRARPLDDDIHINRIATDGRDDNDGGGEITLPANVTGTSNRSDNGDEDDNSTAPRPDALFLSSGELVPFTLEFSADGVDHRFDVTGQANGDITLKRVD